MTLTGLTTLIGFLTPVFAYLSPLSKSQLGSQEFQNADGTPIPPSEVAEGIGKVGGLSGRPTLIVRKDGQLLAYDAVCSHLGCIVRWNNERTSIECPCHGGVFDIEGKVIAGPPPTAIVRISLKIDGDRIYRA